MGNLTNCYHFTISRLTAAEGMMDSENLWGQQAMIQGKTLTNVSIQPLPNYHYCLIVLHNTISNVCIHSMIIYLRQKVKRCKQTVM